MSQQSPVISNQSSVVSDQGSVISGRLHQYGLPLILIVFTLLGLLYDFTVPVFEKPDELKHFAVIQYIEANHRLPVVREGVYKPWDQEGTQPPLYHLLAAAAVSWLDLSDFVEPARNPHYADERSFIWRERGNNNLYLHRPGEAWSTEPVFLAARLARWLSLLAGVGTVTLTYLLARLVFSGGSSWLPLLAAGLVAFVPQFLHTNSAITNDSLSATLAAAALLVLALVIKNGSSNQKAVYLGIILGLGAITKLSLLYLFPLTGLVLLFDLRRYRSFGLLVRYGVIIGGGSLLLAGWWYWRNWQVYGDLTALNAHLLYRGGALDPRPTVAQIWQTELTGLELSFWAAFGAGQILLEPWLFEVLRWLKYVVLVGIIVGVWQIVRWQVASGKLQVASGRLQVASSRWQVAGNMPSAKSTLTILAVLGLWCLIIFVALLRWMQITPASWGRLLYPALPALAVLSVWGLAQFTIHNSQFSIHSSLFPLILTAGLFSLSAVSPFRYIQAAYAKAPLIPESQVPADVQRLDFVYDEALRLIGYRLEQAAVRPGEWLPVTLYWQATQPITKNYSVFVHLLGKDNAVIGQVNTYPDSGNWPTSMLAPGKVLADTYHVPVSPEAAAPAVIRLAMGIFEFEDPTRAAKVAVNPTGEVVEPIVGATPLHPHHWPQLNPTHPLAVNFAGQIKLAGYDWPNEGKIKPGETVTLTFYWETLASPGQNLILFIHLVDPRTESQVAGFDAPPHYPTAFWQPGNTIIDSRRLSLPADLPPSDYELRIGWYNLDNFTRLPLIEENEGQDAFDLLTVSAIETKN